MTQTRANVLALVERYPGVHGREVERQLGLPSRLASYHLLALEADGLVRRVGDGGYARFVVADQRLNATDLEFVCLMRSAPAFHITLLLLSRPEMTPGAFVGELDLAKASVSYHLSALLAAEVVGVDVVGRERRYHLRDPARVRRLLHEFHPLPGELDAFSALWDDLVGGRR
jgi:DNA-binding transcriptional ArsR family regulator